MSLDARLRTATAQPLCTNRVGPLGSRAWIVYWLLHALHLLGADPGYELCTRIVSQLRHMQSTTGGRAQSAFPHPMIYMSAVYHRRFRRWPWTAIAQCAHLCSRAGAMHYRHGAMLRSCPSPRSRRLLQAPTRRCAASTDQPCTTTTCLSRLPQGDFACICKPNSYSLTMQSFIIRHMQRWRGRCAGHLYRGRHMPHPGPTHTRADGRCSRVPVVLPII